MADGNGEGAGITPTGARPVAPPVYRITLAQLAVLGVLSSVTLCFAGAAVALSVVAGGLCNAVPQGWFAWQLFRARRAQAAARGALVAEAGKFALSVAGFALVFAWLRPVVALAVFSGYGAMLLVQLGGGVWLLRRG